MVEWVPPRKATNALVSFSEKIQDEQSKVLLSYSSSSASSSKPNARKPSQSASVVGKERMAKLLSELAISERQKRELEINLEKENDKRLALEKNAQDLSQNLGELRIKYEKSLTYLKLVKRWIEKRKKKNLEDKSSMANTSALEAHLVPVIQEEIGKIKNMLEKIKDERETNVESLVHKPQQSVPATIQPSPENNFHNMNHNPSMRIVSSSSSSPSSVASSPSLKLFSPAIHPDNHQNLSPPRHFHSHLHRPIQLQEENENYSNVLQETLNQIALQQKILEQQERIRQNQDLIMSTKSIQTEVPVRVNENNVSAHSAEDSRPTVTKSDIEEIIRVRIGEEFKKRQKRRPAMPAPIPSVRPAKHNIQRRRVISESHNGQNQHDPVLEHLIDDEKHYRYASDTSSMITSLADLLDDLEIPVDEQIRKRLFKSQSSHRKIIGHGRDQGNLFDSRGTSIDEALERVIKQLNVL